MRVILALACKDLKILCRLKAGLFFTLGWPLLVAVFFGLIFSSGSGSGKLRVALVDEDRTAASQRYSSRLEKQENIEVRATSRDEALSLVRQGKRVAALIIPPGFGQAAERMFYGDPPQIQVWIDPSRKAETAMLEGLLFKLAAEDMQRVFADRSVSTEMVRRALENVEDMPPDNGGEQQQTRRFLQELDIYLNRPTGGETGTPGASWQPLKVESREVTIQRKGPKNSFEVTFPQGVLWGIIGCVMSFGVGIVAERTHGTLPRLQMSTLTQTHLLAGKALACFLAIAAIEIVLFLLGRVFFGVRPSSLLLLGLAGFATAVGFVGIMMLASTFGKTEQSVAGVGWAVMMPIAMLGGGMMPLFIMPGWMVAASNYSPAKWAILALEGALWRGFTLQEMLLPCGVLLLIGSLCFALGTRILRLVR